MKLAWPQWKSLCLGALAALALATPVTASAQTPKLKVRGTLQYVHGINVGWFFGRYSNDIGINPLNPSWGTGYNSAQAGSWFADIKRMNCNVVRVWLFEGMEGLNFDSSGYVSGLQSGFLTNLDDMMAKADANGLAIELTFLNYNMADQFGQTPPGAGAIKNFMTDSTARQRLLDNAIGPIAFRYRNSNAVFGYDLINESNLALNTAYNFAQMRSFASAAVSKIKSQDSDAPVTLSTQWYAFGDQANHASWYGGLGLDYYEYHNYSNTPNLPTVASWLDKPLLLGEFGPQVDGPWTEQQKKDSVDAHVSQAKDRNWAGSLAWMYWHSSGNKENYAITPGAVSDWNNCAWSMQWWGANLGSPPSTTVTIYGDALASDWADWSWPTLSNLNSTSPVKVGAKAIKANSTTGWSAISLRKGTAVSTSGKSSIKFWVHGGASAKNLSFSVQTTDSGSSTGTYTFTVNAGEWKEITVPLSSIGSPSVIKRMNFQNNTSTGCGEYSVDDIRLM